ncbi:phage tail assembly protein [Acetobacter oryzifermentans]|uniref:Phage protein n=1 Tax=Acetobacter oryzifermentans TaxID=1633874 RepID=A0ABN4NRN6_9PROT|nr:phage tail assembly protein [Acetobacter oryzifermentans]ANA14168.1 hypothetical protein WG31_09260 [Acetobacter oryzifermentans]
MTLSDDDVLLAVSDVQEDTDSVETRPGVFHLEKPITLKGGETFETLELHEPVVFHALTATKIIGRKPSLESIYDSQINMVCQISKWPKLAVDQLPSHILDEAIDFLNHFEEDARRNPDETPDFTPELMLTFKPGIEAVGKSFNMMELREPVVAERRAFKSFESRQTFEGIISGEIDLVERISGWPKAAVLKMPISKFACAADYLTGFFMHGRIIGNN